MKTKKIKIENNINSVETLAMGKANLDWLGIHGKFGTNCLIFILQMLN